MRIEIEFIGFPMIYKIFPEGSHPYAFLGDTLSELIDELIKRHGQQFRELFLDQRTHTLDPTIQIMINRKYVGREDIPHQRIGEYDKVTFLRLLAGG